MLAEQNKITRKRKDSSEIRNMRADFNRYYRY